MQEKCQVSNSFDADLHVPIHTNAFNGSVMGTRMFCYSSSGEGYKACKEIMATLSPITPGTSDNITVNQDLYEVRVPSAPTAYVECLFHDNYEEAKWCVEHTTEIGEAIAKGICNYFGIAYKSPVAPAPNGVMYQVVTGSFSVKANAEKRVQELKAKGFDSFIQIKKITIRG